MRKRLTKAFAASLMFVALAIASGLDVTAKTPLTGKLKTRDNKQISVNGNRVSTGTTVVSGARVETPEGVGATIDLGVLGRVDLAPQTSMTLTFGAARVAVNLSSGYVVLTTNKGVEGTVTDASGKVVATDATKTSSVVGRTPGGPGPETAVGAQGGGIGAGTVGVVGGAGAAAGGAAAARGRGRGRNLSPGTPRRN